MQIPDGGTRPAETGSGRAPSVVALSWDDPFIRRAIGTMLVGAALVSIFGLVTLAPETANIAGLLVISALTMVGGILVFVWPSLAEKISFEQVALASVLLCTGGIWFWGDPSSPQWLLYLWPTVLVFSFFPRRDVVLHVATLAFASAAVTIALSRTRPGVGSVTEHVPTWLLLVATVIAVGSVARVLTASVGATDLRLRRGFDDSPIGIALISTDARWLEVNDATCRTLGRQRCELVGAPIAECIHPDDVADAERAATDADDDELVEIETRYVRPGGEIISALVSTRVVSGLRGERFAYSVINDISAQRYAEQRLRHEATHDPLTGLPNRAAVIAKLEEVLCEPSTPDSTVTVMLTDLDHFKVINDSLGHFVGDAALRTLAERMREGLGRHGTIARLGGDEFVFVTRGAPGEAADLGRHLAELIARPIEIDGLTHHLSASVGIATASAGATPHDLLRDADIAMYRAKNTGRGVVEVFGEECRADAIERLDVEQALRRELAEPTGAIEVHYQPIVRTSDVAITGFEALVRWRRGDILCAPARFIPIAEDTGLIVPLGRYVLAEAVATFTSLLERRPDAARLRLHVNISARQVASESLVDDVDAVLSTAGLPRGALVLEVTETALLDERRAAQLCRQLKRSGVGMSLDDFGTGYSAMSHLRRLDLDLLKIDRSFVSGLGVSARDRAIVQSTISLAHAVGMPVVAEGIETVEQLETLREINCDYAQGFLFSRPVPATELDRLIEECGISPELART